MKRFPILLILCGVILAMSCTQTSDSISERFIVKQANKTLVKKAENSIFDTVEVGEYECNNDEERYQLRKLEAAGLITYDVTRYAWWEKTRVNTREAYDVDYYYTWSGAFAYTRTEYRTVKRTDYNFKDHFIVKVALTAKGQKYVVSGIPEPEEEIDEEMKVKDVDSSKYVWNQMDLKEEWPDIKNPFITEVKDAVSQKTPSLKSHANSTKASEKKDNTERIDSLQYKKYMEFTPKSENVYVKCCDIECFKARNIQIYNKEGIPFARAQVLFRTKNCNDFGRILLEYENGIKSAGNIKFDYYLDKGWVFSGKEEDFE